MGRSDHGTDNVRDKRSIGLWIRLPAWDKLRRGRDSLGFDARGSVRKIFRRAWRRGDEQGFTLLLTAIVLPVLVIFAALGIGGAVVRATADETQRTSELSALAAAVNLPNLGRPDTVTGLPTRPVTYPDFLPPSVVKPPATSCSAGHAIGYDPASAYYQIAAAQDCVDARVSKQLGFGPFSSYRGLFSTWRQGCDVAEAQYAAGRARMARNFALSSGGAPKTPLCPDASTGQYRANYPERVYIRPEMESTGAYELQKCLGSTGGCFNSATTTSRDQLSMIGNKYTAEMGAVADRNNPADPASCLVNPTAAGCALGHDELKKTLLSAGVPPAKAEKIASTVSSSMPTQIASLSSKAYAKAATAVDLSPSGTAYNLQPAATQALEGIFASLFATTSGGMCNIALGPASGQTMCGTGVNLASMLPSTLSPRVRAIITHSIEMPLVPNWGNSGEEGDFTFTEQALARRTFKNAVVVPTIPKQLVLPSAGASACYAGGLAANGLAAVAGSNLTTLSNLLVTSVGAGAGASTDTCGNAELDNTVVDPVLCMNGSVVATEAQRKAACKVSGLLSKAINNVNQLPATSQRDMIDAADTFNSKANNAVNKTIAPELQAEDPGGTYNPDDCKSATPAAWCVDVAGQQIRDMQDFYGAPPDGTGPSYNDVFGSAADSNEPVAVMGLSSTVDLCDKSVAGAASGNICTAINAAMAAALGSSFTPADAITSLPMVIPALDVVPVFVHRDAAAPGGYSFELAQNTTSTPGLYRAVLLDPDESFPLCAAGSSARTSCVGQPTVASVGPLPTTTSITLPPTTLPPTTLPPTTLPPTTLPPTTLPPTTLPPTTLPPTTVPTTIKFP
jgi:hypothetical protein